MERVIGGSISEGATAVELQYFICLGLIRVTNKKQRNQNAVA